MEALQWDWDFWSRPAQKLPNVQRSSNSSRILSDGTHAPWLTWLILAGRGFGKTRTGAETVRDLVCGDTPLSPGRYKQVALVGETAADVRETMVGDGKLPGEGSGLLQVHPKDFRPTYEPSKRRLTWPNGAIATCYNGVEPEQLRGPQHDLIWWDELCKFQYAQDCWDQGQFGLRLGDDPKQIVTTTPKPIPVIREIMKSASTVITRGKTSDNRANLAKSFIETVVAKFEGTRLGRQELDAEILDDAPGALWTRSIIETARKKRPQELPQMVRIVVAVDPSGRSDDEDTGDTIGIVVAGLGVDKRGYVLADRSVAGGPNTWGAAAVKAYEDFQADRIVAEKNFGGAMVEYVIRTCNPLVPYTAVNASRGKSVRAEPVAALYEQERVVHTRDFIELEDQMCLLTPTEYLGKGSPDRLDALVWALTELMLEKQSAPARRIFIPHMAR